MSTSEVGTQFSLVTLPVYFFSRVFYLFFALQAAITLKNDFKKVYYNLTFLFIFQSVFLIDFVGLTLVSKSFSVASFE